MRCTPNRVLVNAIVHWPICSAARWPSSRRARMDHAERLLDLAERLRAEAQRYEALLEATPSPSRLTESLALLTAGPSPT